jgi:hypothetical protein
MSEPDRLDALAAAAEARAHRSRRPREVCLAYAAAQMLRRRARELRVAAEQHAARPRPQLVIVPLDADARGTSA